MLTLNIVIVLTGLVFFILLFAKLPTIDSSNLSDDSINDVKISIIIPARNEEHNLPNILSDIKKQTYPLHEIICVNDNSTDNTEKVIKDFGATMVQSKSLPKGWRGKPWACQNGAMNATGDILLFIDADVRLSPDAVKKLVKIYTKNKRAISVQPYHIMKRSYEYTSLFFNMVQICSTGLSLPKKVKRMGFYGPVLFIEREVFLNHGGYEKVKSKVIEDYLLGRYLNKHGIDINLLMGRKDIGFRMYAGGVKSVIEGWSKNFSKAFLVERWWLALLIFTWVSALTALPFVILGTILYSKFVLTAIMSIVYMLFILLTKRVGDTIGAFKNYVYILFPIYIIIFHLIFFYSVLATFVFKSTTWKGRKL